MSDSGLGSSRYTPGGTRVPDGSPPTDEIPKPPPRPPSVPPFPIRSSDYMDDDEFSKFLDGYEKKVDLPGAKRSDRQWEPSHVPTPSEARALWLEREVDVLKTTPHEMSKENGFLESAYWNSGFDSRTHGLSAVGPMRDQSACAGFAPGEVREGRAFASEHGLHQHQVRACTGANAAAELGGERRPDRACMEPTAASDLGGQCRHGRVGLAWLMVGLAWLMTLQRCLDLLLNTVGLFAMRLEKIVFLIGLATLCMVINEFVVGLMSLQAAMDYLNVDKVAPVTIRGMVAVEGFGRREHMEQFQPRLHGLDRNKAPVAAMCHATTRSNFQILLLTRVHCSLVTGFIFAHRQCMMCRALQPDGGTSLCVRPSCTMMSGSKLRL